MGTELNVMLPLIAYNLLQSIHLLANAARLLADKAIAAMTVNAAHMAALIEKSPILVTALSPVIGYDRAAQIAKQAYDEGRPVKEVAAAMTDLSAAELDRLPDPRPMIHGGTARAEDLCQRQRHSADDRVSHPGYPPPRMAYAALSWLPRVDDG